MRKHSRPANFCYADSIHSKQILTSDEIFKCNLILDRMCTGRIFELLKMNATLTTNDSNGTGFHVISVRLSHIRVNG